MIFYTGSPAVGKVVMKAAAENLTPVILELGGKSPCIVDKSANIKIAAKRIIWGKTINAGQTCIAPDYVFVHSSIKEKLIDQMVSSIKDLFGDNIKESHFYSRIVSTAAVDRLQKLMLHGTIRYGGEIDRDARFIAPTIIDEVKTDYPIMQEEIFGPILPIISFDDINEVVEYINNNEKPLAMYFFGNKKVAKNILKRSTSGGCCINDTLLHTYNHNLPFGGVGNSGIGKYHGYYSFLAFSNLRSTLIFQTWIDLPVKYAPYPFYSFVKKFL